MYFTQDSSRFKIQVDSSRFTIQVEVARSAAAMAAAQGRARACEAAAGVLDHTRWHAVSSVVVRLKHVAGDAGVVRLDVVLDAYVACAFPGVYGDAVVRDDVSGRLDGVPVYDDERIVEAAKREIAQLSSESDDTEEPLSQAAATGHITA